ncbi:MAG: HEPN domain-containing protein [Chloroflexi bacterium]|nr:HEPN domain-containing protein [Chloroflexota bacterium]
MSVPTDITMAWLQRAHSDLQLGRTALVAKGVLPEDAAFHAQQCVEKALKALLLHMEVAFPKTHAIEVLLDLLKAQGMKIPKGVDESFELSEYAVQTRYPGEWEPVTKTEARKAIERAGLVLAWVEGQLK